MGLGFGMMKGAHGSVFGMWDCRYLGWTLMIFG